MNKTLHIIRKDLRFNRWALVLWLAAVITHFALRCMQIKNPDWGGSALATSSRIDHLVHFALPLIIIPFLMQPDALLRRYAFWQSLPISKARLLLAKAITLLSVFILLPMAFEITTMFSPASNPFCGVRSRSGSISTCHSCSSPTFSATSPPVGNPTSASCYPLPLWE